MKLVIDIGNSYSKIAVFKDDDIIDLSVVNNINPEILQTILSRHPVSSSILSSVGKSHTDIINYLNQLGYFIELNRETPVPFSNNYGTPSSLGKDRMAIAAAAVKLHPEDNVLIVDTGTCITYDLITANGSYIGGGISPGLNMRFKALNTFTHRLPLVPLPGPERELDLVGNSTESSILSGVVNGVLAEVDKTINQYNSTYSSLKTVISGGDYKYFEKLLKSNIFATPNIVVRGLKNILDFNENS